MKSQYYHRDTNKLEFVDTFYETSNPRSIWLVLLHHALHFVIIEKELIVRISKSYRWKHLEKIPFILYLNKTWSNLKLMFGINLCVTFLMKILLRWCPVTWYLNKCSKQSKLQYIIYINYAWTIEHNHSSLQNSSRCSESLW